MNLEKAIGDIEGQLRGFMGDRKAIIGISGGIDSAVVADLCIRALGKEKVLGISMPYCSNNTEDAELVAKHLGMDCRKVNIKDIADSFDFLTPDKTSTGNIMARVRMVILYSFANQIDGIVVGTGNKSEISVGYFTKYGDGGSDVLPIGDLYKTEIYEVAQILCLPEKIINKKPSADLWEGQTDEGEMGIAYKDLDAVLKGEITNGNLYGKVQKMRIKSEHKRKMPPIFSLGRQYKK